MDRPEVVPLRLLCLPQQTPEKGGNAVGGPPQRVDLPLWGFRRIGQEIDKITEQVLVPYRPEEPFEPQRREFLEQQEIVEQGREGGAYQVLVHEVEDEARDGFVVEDHHREKLQNDRLQPVD